ncbi:hypothetical protein OAA83_03780 [Candidatus Marinimicrobia bacterium]|nr:hypothetical protein [Candidatus Neomarinimicrobiota bacterium]
MIELNKYRKNIFYNYGYNQCPYYGEDGVILKIFETIKTSKSPLCVEFGESRVLGTTTRSFRINYRSKSIYFTGDYGIKSFLLNLIDVIKIIFITKNIKYFKFFKNFPFKYFITLDNVSSLFKKKIENNEIDILTIDIDSYDYYLAKQILNDNYKPRLLILEYNPSFGLEKSLSYPITGLINKNKRLYGASFKALKKLAEEFGYKLCFVSGFCNLFFIREDYSSLFIEPDIKDEITDTNDKVIDYINKYCQEGFIPSWLNQPELTKSDFLLLDQL